MGVLAALGVAAALMLAPEKKMAGESGGVTLWEVCSANQGGFIDGRGETPDWIEIKNTADTPVSLAGFTLGDGREAKRETLLPDVTLEAEEYILLCASGQEGWDGKYYHLPFKISAEGEMLWLGAPDGRVVQLVYLPAMGADESYGMTEDGSMQKNAYSTPGAANSEAMAGYQAAPMGWVEERK